MFVDTIWDLAIWRRLRQSLPSLSKSLCCYPSDALSALISISLAIPKASYVEEADGVMDAVVVVGGKVGGRLGRVVGGMKSGSCTPPLWKGPQNRHI